MSTPLQKPANGRSPNAVLLGTGSWWAPLRVLAVVQALGGHPLCLSAGILTHSARTHLIRCYLAVDTHTHAHTHSLCSHFFHRFFMKFTSPRQWCMALRVCRCIPPVLLVHPYQVCWRTNSTRSHTRTYTHTCTHSMDSTAR